MYLVLDQGGHSTRAMLFDAYGDVLAVESEAVATHHTAPGHTEQSPQALLDSLHTVLNRMAHTHGDQVRQVALVTQRSSLVMWERNTGRALSPVLSWMDRRAAQWLDAQPLNAEDIFARTGLRISAHYGASKLRWCLDHLPAVQTALQAGNLCGTPLASFLLFHLLEDQPVVCDPANAQRTLLFNIHQQQWDAMLLDTFGIPAAILPQVQPTMNEWGAVVVGNYRWPLRLVNGDQSSALFGYGKLHAGSAMVVAGTGAFISLPWPQANTVPAGLLYSPVMMSAQEKIFVAEGTVNGAASAIDWAAETLNIASPELLDRWLLVRQPEVLFLNGVGGLGSPFWSAQFPTQFIEAEGATVTDAARMVAVVESIVFLLHTNLQRMRDAGAVVNHILIAGGLAHLNGFCQKLADITGIEVFRPEEVEASARGAAFWLAGCPDEWAEITGDVFEPTDDLIRARYARWRNAVLGVLQQEAHQ